MGDNCEVGVRSDKAPDNPCSDDEKKGKQLKRNDFTSVVASIALVIGLFTDAIEFPEAMIVICLLMIAATINDGIRYVRR